MARYVPLVYLLSLTSTKCHNFCFWSTFLSLHLISKAGFLVQNLSVSLLPSGICFSFLYHTIIQSFSLVETHLLQQKLGLSLSMCRAIGSRDPQKLSLSRQAFVLISKYTHFCVTVKGDSASFSSRTPIVRKIRFFFFLPVYQASYVVMIFYYKTRWTYQAFGKRSSCMEIWIEECIVV